MLPIMATVQLRNPTEGRAYFDRKKASGKTSMEAMRCLIGEVSAARSTRVVLLGQRQGTASLPRRVDGQF
jgi:hypothetical protein